MPFHPHMGSGLPIPGTALIPTVAERGYPMFTLNAMSLEALSRHLTIVLPRRLTMNTLRMAPVGKHRGGGNLAVLAHRNG